MGTPPFYRREIVLGCRVCPPEELVHQVRIEHMHLDRAPSSPRLNRGFPREVNNVAVQPLRWLERHHVLALHRFHPPPEHSLAATTSFPPPLGHLSLNSFVITFPC